MPRDWDLFSFTVFTPTILLILLIDTPGLVSIRRLMVPILLIMIISPLPYLAVNLNRDYSEEYTEYFMRLDFDKSLSMLVVMYGYYEEWGQQRKSDSLKHVYNTVYINKRKSAAALEALDAGQIEKASNLIAGLREDKYDPSYQRILARYNYMKGNQEQAMEHIDKAIQLRPYYAELYWERGLIYLAQKQPEKFLRELRKGYKLDNRCFVVLDGLAYVNYMLGQYDSSIYYGEKLLALDTSRVAVYYSLALAYATNGDYARADSMVKRFSSFVENDSGMAARYEQLIQTINNLKQRPR
jgi:tetratricopeptide (TPR) repeat protein